MNARDVVKSEMVWWDPDTGEMTPCAEMDHEALLRALTYTVEMLEDERKRHSQTLDFLLLRNQVHREGRGLAERVAVEAWGREPEGP